MGRARKKIKQVSTQTTPESSSLQPSVPSLLAKAQTLIVQCDYPLAQRFIKRALEKEPTHAEAREMFAVVLLETGDIDTAKQIFETLIPPHPDAPSPPPSSAYLYLAQLSDDDPQAALQHYQTAVDLMNSQLKGKERAAADSSPDDDDAEVRRNIVRALIGMVEIWMDPSYDLCFDPAAESTCESLLALALQTDPNNTEALQSLASVRLSQQRPDEAKAYLLQAWSSWKDLVDSSTSILTDGKPTSKEGEDSFSKIPPIPTRISLAKMFLELECFEEALVVLTGILDEDDQEVEAWYLEGWCLFLMAEKLAETAAESRGGGGGGEGDGGEVTSEGLARDARDCLETCKTLHETQNHPDTPLLEHVQELIGRLDSMGIEPSPEDEDQDADAGGEDGEGEWEDVGSEDDEDVEMS